MSLTQSIGAFIAGLTFGQVGEEAAAVAQRGFVDCTGVMIAGRNEPPTQILRHVLASDGPRETSLYFTSELTSALSAALINATAAHALDFDDVAMDGHPSCVLVPAILAEGEAGDAPGKDMITAYLAGYETWAELVKRERGLIYEKGWHPTGVIGTVAASAACASIPSYRRFPECRADRQLRNHDQAVSRGSRRSSRRTRSPPRESWIHGRARRVGT
jgi:2-methylcitrate dehydratase PrpD